MGYPPKRYRKATKKILVALLNGDKADGHPENVEMTFSYPDIYSRSDFEQLLRAMHPLLAGYFRTGEGLRNQRLDSDIAIDVITDLRVKGILALPIYDSFIVNEQHKGILRDSMIINYQSRLGYNPVIEEEG